MRCFSGDLVSVVQFKKREKYRLINIKRRRKILLKELIPSKDLHVQSQKTIKETQRFVKYVQSKE